MARSALVMTLVLFGSGCLGSETTACPWGVICPAGMVCDEVHEACVLPAQIEGCRGQPNGSPCSFPGAGQESAQCRDGVCWLGGCGDGFLSSWEECDGELTSRPYCIDFVEQNFQAGSVGCTEECGFDWTRCWKEGWAAMPTTGSEHLLNVKASNSGLVLASGMAGKVLGLNRRTGSWELLEDFFTMCELPTPERLFGLWVSPEGDRFMTAGDGCIVVRAWLAGLKVVDCHVDVVCNQDRDRLYDVWGLPDFSRLWVVGGGGWLFTYTDSDESWSQQLVDPGSGEFGPYGIWGRSESEIYISGVNGLVLRGDGQQWESLNQDLTTETITSVWGPADSTELYATGIYGALLFHDGNTWKNLDPDGIWIGGAKLHRVTGSNRNDVWISGIHGLVGHFDGMSWTLEFIATNEVHGIAAGGPFSEVFAVGTYGMAARYGGRYWMDLTWPEYTVLRSVAALWDGSVVAVGDEGTVLRHDGSRFDTMQTDLGTPVTLTGVWAGSAHAIAVGHEGTVMTLDGTGWESRVVDPGVNLLSVAGVEDGGELVAVAVGTGGTVYWYDGVDWTLDTAVPATGTLYGVWVTLDSNNGAREAYAVGERGALLRHGQGAWETMDSPLDVPHAMQPDLYSVSGDPERVVAVGDGGALWVLNRTLQAFQTVSSGTAQPLLAVWAPPAGGEFFVTGQDGTVLYFDGRAWSPMEPVTCKANQRPLRALGGTARNNVFAVGDKGCFMRFTGRMPPAADPSS